jgi:hypothetical protein
LNTLFKLVVAEPEAAYQVLHFLPEGAVEHRAHQAPSI